MEKASSMLSSIFGGDAGEPTATITSIFIYPIKSCRGISVSQAPITSTGFRWDRQWVVVNSKGRAYTQRIEPKLALVEVALPNEAFNEDWEPTDTSYLVLKAPGMDELKISLNKPCQQIDDISVWEWSGPALDEGAEASEWFSKYMGKPSRLVRFNAASETRAVDPEYARGSRVMFSDGYPFLLISQGSLKVLNELLPVPVPINRFRPKYFGSLVYEIQWLTKSSSFLKYNLVPEETSLHVIPNLPNYLNSLTSSSSMTVETNQAKTSVIRSISVTSRILVDGCDPFSEDLWMAIKINKSMFEGVKLCARCKVPTVNQDNGIPGPEPTATLLKFRSDNVLRPTTKVRGKVYFGQNLVCKDRLIQGKGKVIQVGDPIYVLKKVSSPADAPA